MTDTDLVEAVKQDAHAMNRLTLISVARGVAEIQELARRRVRAQAEARRQSGDEHADTWLEKELAAIDLVSRCEFCNTEIIGYEDCIKCGGSGEPPYDPTADEGGD